MSVFFRNVEAAMVSGKFTHLFLETLMKKWLSLLALVMTLGLGTVHLEAEARRMGGGKSLGMQRQATPPANAPNTPAAAPAAAAGGAAAGAGRSWMGPVAGLAAGLGIAALASYLGFGAAFANMLMIGLLLMAVIAVVGFIMRRRAAAQQGGRLAQAGASAGASRSNQPAGNAYRTASTPVGGSIIGSAIGGNQAASNGRIPADFDVAGFVRNAKVNFIRLQAANDAGNLDDLRAFTTPEVFAELKMDLTERGATQQHTDVERLEASVIDVEDNGSRYLVSVHFTGETRENNAAQADNVNEIWHLTKPRHGAGGWVLAGIQQNS
jgi:predicted lipid-binding transport protein (Tim44 family)